MNTLLSVGHGYSAQALARRLLPAGWRIVATTRSEEKARALAATGVEPVVWQGGALPLSGVTHLLSSVAPEAAGDPVLRDNREAIAAAGLTWIGYLSTTAVYGDHAGGWVDEDTPPAPAMPRAIWRAKAEAEWSPLSAHVFRLAGIYGPGRGPFEKLRAGTARRIVKPGQLFSRIHVEDIAQVLAASMARPDPGRVYNVCDDEAAPADEVLACAADISGLPLPPAEPYDPATMTAMAASFYSESRRVRNDRIKTELGVRLLYPTYREGLAALFQAS